MSDDDSWDVDDIDDKTDCTKKMPKISFFVKSPKSKDSVKTTCTAPDLTFFECECPSNFWRSIEIRPVASSPDNTDDIKYMLTRDEANGLFKLEVVAGKQEEVQCYWECMKKEENVFEAVSYTCERLLFGATYKNPYSGRIEDGIFGPNTYGKILFGKKWKYF